MKMNKAQVKAKIEAIKNSKMPEHQKQAMFEALGVKPSFDPSKRSFENYAAIREIPEDRVKAMLVYPKASGVKQATLGEWDEIFKNF